MKDTWDENDCIHVNTEDASCRIRQGCGGGRSYCKVIWDNDRCYAKVKPGEEETKCPNCAGKCEMYMSMPPIAHLNVGELIEWCTNCGTIFTHFDGSNKMRELRVPQLTKANPDR